MKAASRLIEEAWSMASVQARHRCVYKPICKRLVQESRPKIESGKTNRARKTGGSHLMAEVFSRFFGMSAFDKVMYE
jgi:hypothetical protein